MNRSSHANTRLRWQARVDAQLASGLSIAQFCQQHDYSIASFYQWKRKLTASSSTAHPQTANPNATNGNPFQQVVPKRLPTSAAWVELSLPGGAAARIPADQLDAFELAVRLTGSATLLS